MTQYRKKHVVEASQWFKDGDHPAVIRKTDPDRYGDEGIPWCPTLEGGHIVTPGDWILTGIQGEHWPVKADIFAATYELAAHAAQEEASEPQKYVEGFLCCAWGETDLPEARLVRSRAEWEAFVVEAQWGPDAEYDSMCAEDKEMVDGQVRYIAHDMADNGAGCIEFEIGGVSVERVTFLAPAASAPKTGEGSAIEGGDSTDGGQR